MKIAEIRKLCQRNKTIILYRHGHEQWVSDGRAIYPLAGLPTMVKESITALMDVPEDKADGYYIDKSSVPPNICLDDNCQEEMLCQTNYTLSDLQPLYTPAGSIVVLLEIERIKNALVHQQLFRLLVKLRSGVLFLCAARKCAARKCAVEQRLEI